MWKRAFLYVMRNRGRSVILLLVLFTASALSLVGLSVQRSAVQAAEEYRKTLGSSFTVSTFMNKEAADLWEVKEAAGGSIYTYTGPTLTNEKIAEVMETEGVSGYETEQDMPVYTEDLNPGKGLHYANLFGSDGGEDRNRQEDLFLYRTFSLFGVRNSERHRFFRTEAFTLTAGTHLTPDSRGKALISEEMAERNGLWIGDTFTIECREALATWDMENDRRLGEFPLEIAGIFRVNASQKLDENMIEDWYAGNFIFADAAVVTQANSLYDKYYGRTEPIYAQAVFFVDDPAQLDETMEQVGKLDWMDPAYFRMKKDDTAYRAAAEPLNLMNGLSVLLVVILAGGAAVVSGLLLTAWMQSRKHEMGLLLAVGITKKKIFGQLLIEALMLAAVAFAGAGCVSAALADTAGEAVQELFSPRNREAEYIVDYVPLEGHVIRKTAAEKIDLTYSVSGRDVVLVILAGMGVTAASVGIASAKVLKMKPKDLSSR